MNKRTARLLAESEAESKQIAGQVRNLLMAIQGEQIAVCQRGGETDQIRP